ncbi:hypothetical protein EP837_01641 [Sphingobium sp. EP60837]|nr:hypothetical protein EP837_01641 [Sphingobium sp. EP60837]
MPRNGGYLRAPSRKRRVPNPPSESCDLFHKNGSQQKSGTQLPPSAASTTKSAKTSAAIPALDLTARQRTRARA